MFALLVIAPLFYSFLYPQPYLAQTVRHVPVAIVDEDRSAISERIRQYVKASPELTLKVMYANEAQMQDAMADRRIFGALIIPNGTARQVARHEQATVAIIGNGAYFSVDTAVLNGFIGAVQAVGTRIAQQRAAAGGTGTLTVHGHYLFNPQNGYANYVIPAVAVLIIQQTAVLGIAMLIAVKRERREGRERYAFTDLLGELFAYSTIVFCSLIYYEGYVMWAYDLPRSGRFWDICAFGAMLALAIAAFSMLLAAFFDRAERAFQMWIFTSIFLLFISGYAWPASALPPLLRDVRWIFPSTSGILGLTKLAQMHAEWHQIGPEVLALVTIIVVATIASSFALQRAHVEQT